jgi:sortase (surface protein transpeptidase)
MPRVVAAAQSYGKALLPMDMPGAIPIGEIEIPSIGLSAMVLDGDDEHTLRLAVGHIPGTAIPGRSGNVGIAGHRDTFFRPLRKIKAGDENPISYGSRHFHVPSHFCARRSSRCDRSFR